MTDVRPIIPPYRIAVTARARVPDSLEVNTEVNSRVGVGVDGMTRASLVLNRRARAARYPPKFYRRHVRPLKGRPVPRGKISWAAHNAIQLFDGTLEPVSIVHCGLNATLGRAKSAVRSVGLRKGKGTRRRPPRAQTPSLMSECPTSWAAFSPPA